MRDLPRPQPLRMRAHHERLAHLHARPVPRRDQFMNLGQVQRQRLFAQHVLARLRRSDRPRHMQMIGQRIVDGVDLRILQQILVRPVRFGETQRPRRLLRPALVARGDRRHFAPFALPASRESLFSRRCPQPQARPSGFFSAYSQCATPGSLAKIVLLRLFVPEYVHGFHARGANRREKRGERRYRHNQNHN